MKSLNSKYPSNLKQCIFIRGIQSTDQKFHYNTSIEYVILDSSVKEIATTNERGSFQNCSSLSQVSIYSVISIGINSFFKCSSLKEIVIPSSVTTIGNQSFCECFKLEKISLSSSLISIGEHAFRGCSSLRQITIPNTVTSIGQSALCQC